MTKLTFQVDKISILRFLRVSTYVNESKYRQLGEVSF